MNKSLKNVLMSGAATSAVVGGAFVVINSQQTIATSEGTPEEVSSSFTSEESRDHSLAVSSSSNGAVKNFGDEKLKDAPIETKEEVYVNKEKEVASSVSTVPNLQLSSLVEGISEDDNKDNRVDYLELLSVKNSLGSSSLPSSDSNKVQESVEKLEGSTVNKSDEILIPSPKATQEVSASKSESSARDDQSMTNYLERDTKEVSSSFSEVSSQSNDVKSLPKKETPKVSKEVQPNYSSVTESVPEIETPQSENKVSYEVGKLLIQEEKPIGSVNETGQPLTHEELPTYVVSEKGEPLVQEENPVGVVSEKGEPLVQEDNPTYTIYEKGEPLVQEENPVGVISEKGEPLVQEDNPTYVVSATGQPLVQEENPVGVVYEKGEPLVQEENPVGVVYEKGEPLVQEENPVGVVFEKGQPLVREDVPIYNSSTTSNISEKGVPEVQPSLEELIVTEKGEPLVEPEKPVGIISEKGESLVQEENPIYVVSKKGEPLVQEENPVGIVSEKGEPLVEPEKPVGIISEKGEPLIEPEKPLGIFYEKGTPEILVNTLPEYNFKIVRRDDVTPISTAFLNLGDFRKEVGEREKIVEGRMGKVTKVYEDIIGEKEILLNSTLKSETVEKPVYHIYRYGTKPVGSNKGEEGLYRLHEHTSDLDIVDFHQDITLSGEEIKALGQAEITRRANNDSLNNYLTLANSNNYSLVTLANAPLSEEVIGNLNNGTYINHKQVGLEVMKLVNTERKRLGKSELVWSDSLFTLTQKRADEIGKNGHIRFWNEHGESMAHVRDTKGTEWSTVTDGTPFEHSWLGENLAGYTIPQNVYKAFSEKAIAEHLYNQWRNSSGHYANMIDEHYRKFAFDMSYSVFWRNDNSNIDFLAQGIHGVQLFSN